MLPYLWPFSVITLVKASTAETEEMVGKNKSLKEDLQHQNSLVSSNSN